ncbi:MAG: adenine phosphoribosyltransferase [Deltaproteobacteria bacterium]|nr:adenine phosphoribosyltransferase [Deltaproteobacteria bacterium]
MRDLKAFIRDIPDFPKSGILFRDLTPLLLDATAFRETVELICDPFLQRVDVVVGIESRGFIVGAAVAYHLGTGLALVRKPGKLPAATFEARYDLEYGTDGLQIHQDAFRHGSRVLIVDDLLATGGTAAATIELTRRSGGEVVACAFVIELDALGGRERLAPTEVHSLIRYGG